MILSETEEILVIMAGAVVLMAIVSTMIKDYQKMSREAKKKIAQREKDRAYVNKLKRVIDEKNEELQRQIKKKNTT